MREAQARAQEQYEDGQGPAEPDDGAASRFVGQRPPL